MELIQSENKIPIKSWCGHVERRHGAGRAMGRNDANRRLTLEDVRAAMKDVVFDGWKSGKKKKIDLSEAPQAYKNIETVMESQKDLVDIQTKLLPLGVVKG